MATVKDSLTVRYAPAPLTEKRVGTLWDPVQPVLINSLPEQHSVEEAQTRCREPKGL